MVLVWAGWGQQLSYMLPCWTAGCHACPHSIGCAAMTSHQPLQECARNRMSAPAAQHSMADFLQVETGAPATYRQQVWLRVCPGDVAHKQLVRVGCASRRWHIHAHHHAQLASWIAAWARHGRTAAGAGVRWGAETARLCWGTVAAASCTGQALQSAHETTHTHTHTDGTNKRLQHSWGGDTLAKR